MTEIKLKARLCAYTKAQYPDTLYEHNVLCSKTSGENIFCSVSFNTCLRDNSEFDTKEKVKLFLTTNGYVSEEKMHAANGVVIKSFIDNQVQSSTVIGVYCNNDVLYVAGTYADNGIVTESYNIDDEVVISDAVSQPI